VARIRTIKPDAFKSETLSSVSRGARWTFAGLWTYCDDAGIGRADSRLIKAELYPLDDDTTAAVVDSDMVELIEAGCLHTFQSGGKVYIHIPGTKQHQKINRPTPSVLPACPCTIPHPLSEDSVSAHGDVSGEMEGKGKGRGNGGGRATADAAPDPTPTPELTPDKRPPRHCSKHPGGTEDPCRACGDARKAHDAWRKPTLSAKTTKCGRHPERRARDCPECAAEVKPAPSGWRKRHPPDAVDVVDEPDAGQ
jgi:hypothetical protein